METGLVDPAWGSVRAQPRPEGRRGRSWGAIASLVASRDLDRGCPEPHRVSSLNCVGISRIRPPTQKAYLVRGVICVPKGAEARRDHSFAAPASPHLPPPSLLARHALFASFSSYLAVQHSRGHPSTLPPLESIANRDTQLSCNNGEHRRPSGERRRRPSHRHGTECDGAPSRMKK